MHCAACAAIGWDWEKPGELVDWDAPMQFANESDAEFQKRLYEYRPRKGR